MKNRHHMREQGLLQVSLHVSSKDILSVLFYKDMQEILVKIQRVICTSENTILTMSELYI